MEEEPAGKTKGSTWERGRFNVGMSNSVTTAIRDSVKEMAIGKTKTTEKADRATVEQVSGDNIVLVLSWNNPIPLCTISIYIIKCMTAAGNRS